jgi:hypothetical protein
MAKKKYLWIKVKERTSRNIGLEIGVDITQKEVDELLELDQGEFDIDSEEYELINSRLDTRIDDSEGFLDVDIMIQEH